jgi:lipoprotein-anchoring transpeptidase ErfK/SrfK
MSRSRPKTSRFLLIFLGLAVAIGVFVFAFRHRQNRAMAAPELGAPAGAGAAAAGTTPGTPKPDPAEADAVVTQTPGAGAVTSVTPTTPSSPTASAPKPQATTPVAAAPAKPQVALAEVILSSKPLADAKAKADAGKLVEARDIYNAVITGGKQSPDEVRAAKQELSALNEKIVFTKQRFDGDPWVDTFVVPPGGVLAKIAKRFDLTPELLMRVNGITNPKRIQPGQKLKVIKGPLHAVVDKSDFTLDIYFGAPGGPGSSYLTTFRVGLGKDDSTPTGKWLVEPDKKLANPTYFSPRGEGVIGPDDPRNPLGEYWIGLRGIDGAAVGSESYGIHGTIEPATIGKEESMGCIRLTNEDAGRVFELLVEGKSIVIVRD